MKLFLISILLLFFVGATFAQKKYNAVLFVTHADSVIKKYEGRLKAVNDSFVTITLNGMDTSFFYENIQQIKIRKHNGYMRSVFPIIAGVSIGAGLAAYFTNNGNDFIFTKNTAAFFVSGLLFFGANQYALFVYYFTRNKRFEINGYDSFLNFKKASLKYLAP